MEMSLPAGGVASKLRLILCPDNGELACLASSLKWRTWLSALSCSAAAFISAESSGSGLDDFGGRLEVCVCKGLRDCEDGGRP